MPRQTKSAKTIKTKRPTSVKRTTKKPSKLSLITRVSQRLSFVNFIVIIAILGTAIVLITNAASDPGSRGPNGRHWPTHTPAYTTAATKKIDTLTQLNDALATAKSGDVIEVAPHTFSQSGKFIINKGNAAWEKNVLVRPQLGKIQSVITDATIVLDAPRVTLAGFQYNSAIQIEGKADRSALARSILGDTQINVRPASGTNDTLQDVGLYEIVAPYPKKGADRLQLNPGPGNTVERFTLAGSYLKGAYRIAGSTDHSDTLQLVGVSGGRIKDVTIEDTVLFASSNAAVQINTVTGTLKVTNSWIADCGSGAKDVFPGYECGGSYSINLPTATTPSQLNVILENNEFPGLLYARGNTMTGSNNKVSRVQKGSVITGPNNVISETQSYSTPALPDLKNSWDSGAVQPAPTPTTPAPETPTPNPSPEPTLPPEPSPEPEATVTLKGLTDGQTVSGSVRLEAVPANAPNFKAVDFYLDNTFVNTQSGAPICLFFDDGTTCSAYDISKVSNGSHTFRAVMKYDGEKTKEAKVTVNVANPTSGTNTPQSSDTQPPSKPTSLTRALEFDWTKFRYVIRLNWQASTDNVGVTKYVIKKNNQVIATQATTSYVDADITTNTLYAYSVEAQDAAQNTSPVATTTARGSCFLFWCSLEAEIAQPAPPAPAPSPAPAQTIGTYKPSATTTGVPAGTKLTVVNGDLNVTANGTVVDAKDVRGFIIVNASNVTIKRTVVRGRATTSNSAMIKVQSGTNLLIEDVELDNQHPSVYVDGISGGNMTVRRANIHGTVDGIKLGSNSKVEGSYIHSLTKLNGDPNQGGKATHNDAIQILSGTTMSIMGNNMHPGTGGNAAIQITQHFGAVSGVTIDKNWLNGGGCSLNVSHATRTSLTVSATNNKFGRNTTFSCPILLSTKTTMNGSSNTYEDNGQAVPIQKHD